MDQDAQESIELPFNISFHCAIHLTEQSFILIGGIQNGSVSRLTWIIDFKSNPVSITTGPQLIQKRTQIACGKMLNGKGISKLVVAGGKDETGSGLNSVEVLMLSNNEWEFGE